MSVAALQPPAAIYREDQFFAWPFFCVAGIACLAILFGGQWIGLLFLAGGAADGGWLPPAPKLGLAGVGFLLFALSMFRMTTEVGPTDLRISYGIIPYARAGFPLIAIRSVEAVRCRPFLDRGHWLVPRSRAGDRLFMVRGDRGVRLTMADGSTVIVGSQRSEELALVIDGYIRAAR